MDKLSEQLQKNIALFSDKEQALVYTTLLREGALGAEKIHQKTGLHRETIQRTLKKMVKAGTVQIIKTGRNKKAFPTSISSLQEMLESSRDNFNGLLKPLLEAEANRRGPKVEVYTTNHAFGLLQLKLIKLQPIGQDIEVISTHPKEWVQAMVDAKKLKLFEDTRLKKEIRFLLSCFSEFRGQVEYNNREFFASQPPSLKRQYRYIETDDSSPLQVQVWFSHIVISIFESSPSVHIVIEDARVVKAMRAHFNVLWSIGTK